MNARESIKTENDLASDTDTEVKMENDLESDTEIKLEDTALEWVILLSANIGSMLFTESSRQHA